MNNLYSSEYGSCTSFDSDSETHSDQQSITSEDIFDCSKSHSSTDFSLSLTETIIDPKVRKLSKPELSEQVTDKIISVFIVKRPLRLIDKESKDVEITYEESEERLRNLLLLSAIVFVILSSSLSFYLLNERRNQQIYKPWDTVQNQDIKEQSFPTFNFIVMDQEGNLESLRWINQKTLKLNYKLKLPKPGNNDEHPYFLYTEKSEIYVVNGNMKITKIASNGEHRTIPDSSMPFDSTMLSSTSFRVGKFFWFLGRNNDRRNEDIGYSDTVQVGPHFHSVQGLIESYGPPGNIESQLWSIGKLKWFPGPSLGGEGWVYPSGAAINRTFGLILSATLEGYTGFHLFNLEPFSFQNNSKFLYHGPDTSDFNFPSSTCIVSERMKKKVFYGLNVWKSAKQQFHLYEIDIDTLKWEEISVPVKEFVHQNNPNPNESNQGIITSIKGQLYLFSLYTKKVFYMDSYNGSWHEFERDGNITDILTILPYQA